MKKEHTARNRKIHRNSALHPVSKSLRIRKVQPESSPIYQAQPAEGTALSSILKNTKEQTLSAGQPANKSAHPISKSSGRKVDGRFTWQKASSHLKTINAHKNKVMELCFQIGLYKQGLLHDLSKYSPQELSTGFHYFQGNRSPIDAQKEDKGYSMSWLHHKGRNPHHWEYWLDNSKQGVKAQKMPVQYVAEMFCDRIAASMIYQKDKYNDASALDYYNNSRPTILIHPDTERLLLKWLTTTANSGLKAAQKQIRRDLKTYRHNPVGY